MHIIADAQKDLDGWLEIRRRYITASDIFKLLNEAQLRGMGWWRESWMDGGLEDMIEAKLSGEKPDFASKPSVLWGQSEEDHNRLLFSEYSGLQTWGCHYFVGNERWPYLATTLDGFSFREDTWEDLAKPEMFGGRSGYNDISTADQVRSAIKALPVEQKCLLEMKQTGEFSGKAWFNGYSKEPVDRSRKSKVIRGEFVPHGPTMPVYYLGQVQTQMAITGVGYNIAVVKCGASYMTAHTYKANPRWLKVLDQVNEKVAESVEQLRKDLEN